MTHYTSSLDNIDEPLHITYNYTRKEFGDWENHRIPAPMPFLLYAKAPNEKPESVPFWLGSPAEESLEARVELPSGYSLSAPEDVNTKYEFAEYHASYQVGQSVLIAKRQLSSYRTQVSVAELGNFDTFRKSINDDYQKMVTLSVSDASAQPENRNRSLLQQAFDELPDSSNADASRSIDQGQEQLDKNDFPGAIATLTHAIAADPSFARGWIALGTAYLLHGNPEEAVKAFRSAINADPKQSISYRILASQLMAMQKLEEALKVAQELIRITPNDGDVHADLGTLLYKLKRYTEAAAEYESAIKTGMKTGKDSATYEAQLGLAYIKAGDHERGTAAIDKAVALDSTPLSLNNIAYELADANLELTKSQDYAEKAVAAVEMDSATISLDKLTTKDLARMSALAADWDTLGWVHFRAGNLDEAQKYLEAAWNLGQYAIVGDHLGQIYEAQHKPSAAIQAYVWALAASPTRMSPNDMPETRKRLADLRSAATAGTSPNAGEDLGKMRTTHLQRIVPGSASADFFLLISEGPKVEDVTFVSGDAKLKSAADALKKAKLNVVFPDHAQTRLLRRGMVVCSSITGCEFVLLTPDSVKSVN